MDAWQSHGQFRMRSTVVKLLIALSIGCLTSCNVNKATSYDLHILNIVDSEKDLVSVLTFIDSEETAKIALSQLKTIGSDKERKLADLNQRLANTSESTRGDIWRKLQNLMEESNKRIRKEYLRISRDPVLWAIVKDSYPFLQIEADFKRIVNAQLLRIDSAIAYYFDENKRYPSTLSDLLALSVKNDRSISPQDLIDPWERPIQYDANGMRNMAKKPDVWSPGPLHGEGKKTAIGNWEDQ